MCVCTEISLDCATGFIDQLQADTISIGLRVRPRTPQQQRIIPQLNFTCNGSLTKWIFVATWRSGNRNSYPELQIWRPNGSDSYTKWQNSTVNITTQPNTNRYEYIPNPPLEFQAGDVVGIFQPSQAGRRFHMQYYQGDMYNQLMNYYLLTNTSEFQYFSIKNKNVMQEDVLPLITVEISK